MFFFVLLVAKKISQSILIVFLEPDPTTQIFFVLIVEAIFLFFFIFVRPFKKETYFNWVYGIGEMLIFAVTIIFTLMSFVSTPDT